MYDVLQIVTTMLVALAMAMATAHALELPGKRRLDRETYHAVQRIYYPGFTIGGVFGEFGAPLLTFVLLLATPWTTFASWLTVLALVALLRWSFAVPADRPIAR